MTTEETNLLWGRKTVAKLIELGLRDVVISPGSRSTPLTYAFAESKVVESIPVLDERSAGFFALGLAKVRQVPVAIVCTSGSAVANLFPAIVEAKMAGVPLLVLTADRPPELQNCHAGQTIDQQNIFGSYAALFKEVPLPNEAKVESLEEMLDKAFTDAICQAGPVHLNFPFREPLLPESSNITGLEESQPLNDCFFELRHESKEPVETVVCPHNRVLVIAGAGGPGLASTFGESLLAFVRGKGWPILADPLSQLRNTSEDDRELVVAHYDAILRDDKAAHVLQPQAILQVGALPTSKVLRKRLQEWNSPGWIISPLGENFDPLHSDRTLLPIFPETLESSFSKTAKAEASYAHAWHRANLTAEQQFEEAFGNCTELFEGKVAWLLNACMPAGSSLHVASSMPIRDVEFFWKNSDSQHQITANRGANGIDGTLSTALGIAQDSPHTFLLTGDLAFLHDSNGLLLASNTHYKGCLTVILINNNGGGIFENLPIAQHNPPFEEFFATPQHINVAKLAQAHNIPHLLIHNWESLAHHIANPTNHPIRILEINTCRKSDTETRKEILQIFCRIST